MEKISVNLSVKDKDFERALGRGLMETGRINISPMPEAKVLLFDEGRKEYCEKALVDGFSGLRVLLRENPAKASRGEQIPSMYRYTPAIEMVSLLEYILGRGDSEQREERAKVIVLISDEGGTGVSTIGVNLARLLSRKDGAIYLNLCPFATSPKEILWGERDFVGGKTWMRMLYGFKKGKRGLLPAVTESIEEMTYIPAPHINNHGDGIDEEILENLRKEAFAEGYGYLILDIGSHLEGNRKKLVERAFRVVGVNPGYDLEMELRERFGERFITIVNLYREDAVEVKGDRQADIHIGYSRQLGRRSLDEELREAFEDLAIAVTGKKHET